MTSVEKKQGNWFLAALFISGMSIGLGFIAIPVLMGPIGFFPGIVIAVASWLYILLVGLLYAEATLTCPPGANVVTICHHLIGRFGVIVGAGTFVFNNVYRISVYYALAVPLFTFLFGFYTHVHLEHMIICVSITFSLIFTLYFGIKFSVKLNAILFAGLILTVIVIVTQQADSVISELLLSHKWIYIFFSAPAFYTTYYFQSLIPTITSYLGQDPKRIRLSLVWGSLIPLFMFIAWLWLILGSTEKVFFLQAFGEDEPLLSGLLLLVNMPYVGRWIALISVLALYTSFLATTNAFADFVSDAMHVPVEKRKGPIRLLYGLFFLIPSMSIGMFVRANIIKLDFIFNWTQVIFHSILPIWLVFSARYFLKVSSPKLVPGGKVTLLILAFAAFFVIYLMGLKVISPSAW